MKQIAFHYLDTSALIKLLLYPDIIEDGSEALANYRKQHSCFRTTDLCVGECLNVLKRKYFKEKQLTKDGYLLCINRLSTMTKPQHSLKVINVDLQNDTLFHEASKIVKQHNIDFVDAIVIILSKSEKVINLLITADKAMWKTAKDKDISVWHCIKEAMPV